MRNLRTKIFALAITSALGQTTFAQQQPSSTQAPVVTAPVNSTTLPAQPPAQGAARRWVWYRHYIQKVYLSGVCVGQVLAKNGVVLPNLQINQRPDPNTIAMLIAAQQACSQNTNVGNSNNLNNPAGTGSTSSVAPATSVSPAPAAPSSAPIAGSTVGV